MGRIAVVIGSLLSLAAWSAQAATSSTVVEVRLVVVDSCRTAQAITENDTRVSCDRGTPYHVQRSQTETPTQGQAQSNTTTTARTVTVTY